MEDIEKKKIKVYLFILLCLVKIIRFEFIFFVTLSREGLVSYLLAKFISCYFNIPYVEKKKKSNGTCIEMCSCKL